MKKRGKIRETRLGKTSQEEEEEEERVANAHLSFSPVVTSSFTLAQDGDLSLPPFFLAT